MVKEHSRAYRMLGALVLVSAIVVSGVLPWMPGTVRGQADDAARVLILHSYHVEYLWEQELNTGIMAALADGGYSEDAGNLVLDYFWMDTKRNTTNEYYAEIAAAAHDYIVAFDPDVVIASDNNAIQMVVATWPDELLPFVFAGLNNDPEDVPGLAGRANVTGVLERAHITQTLEWIRYVLPDARRVMYLADASTTTYAYIDVVRAEFSTSEIFDPINLMVHMTNSYSQWQNLITTYGANVDAFIVGTYQTLRDDAEVVVPSADVMKWTVENSPAPVVPLWVFGVQEGGLGGPVISGETQGYEAGSKAVLILQGEAPANIPITTPARGKLSLNAGAVARWQLQIPLDLVQVSTIYGPDGQVLDR